jgi:predicted  nucleic acid-binding Zn-ribbon protein
MPHRCIECKSILESGELDLSTGCPVCGGKKFQYYKVKRDIKARGHKEAPAPKAEPADEAKPEAKEPEAREPEARDKKAAHERIESVRILEKGSYDINLPVLLSRKELVMSKEEGVYVVDLPSALKTPKKKR